MDLNRVASPAETPLESAIAHASPRLKNAAHQFEASLLTELLKPMRDRSELSGQDESEDDDEDSSAGSSMREYGTEAMAQCLSEHGGIGIARMVLAKLAPLETREQPGAEEGEKSQSVP